MGSISGLLALMIWGAEPAQLVADGSKADAIVCEVQVLTVDGLSWRTDMHRRLKSVARQGTSTIWTADRDVKARLEELSRARAIKAPKVCSNPDAVASIHSDKVVEYTRHVEMQDHAAPARGLSPSVTFAAEKGLVREGFEATFAGKRLDQGVLAHVKVAESHIGAMHKVPVEGGLFGMIASVPLAEGTEIDFDFNIVDANHVDLSDAVIKSLTASGPAGRLAAGLALALRGDDDGATARNKALNAQCAKAVGIVEVPEVFLSQVEGEWLVPEDGVLVISMGVNTVADEEGKAVVQDRLAILDFGDRVADETCPAATTTPTSTFKFLDEQGNTPTRETEPAAVPIALSTLNIPAVPDRSLPEAIDKDGRVIDLPPLPEAYAAADLNQISPGSPLATAQAPPIRTAGVKPMADPALARTSFEPTAPEPIKATTDPRWRFGSSVTPPAGDCRFAEYGPTALATMVADFLRRGMTQPGCDEDGCPGATCPLPTPDGDEADGCPECPATGCPAAPTGGRVEMGVSVRDGTGARVADSECDLVAALRNPGTTETKYIELGQGMALEIQARVVARPDATQVRDGKPARAAKPVSVQARTQTLLDDADKLRAAGDEWKPFWFKDQPSQMTPFRSQGGSDR